MDFLKDGFVVEGVDFLFADEINGGAQESARAGGGVEDFFAKLGRGHLRHELGDGARGVVFALVAGVAQFDEDGFVDVPKMWRSSELLKSKPLSWLMTLRIS